MKVVFIRETVSRVIAIWNCQYCLHIVAEGVEEGSHSKTRTFTMMFT